MNNTSSMILFACSSVIALASTAHAAKPAADPAAVSAEVSALRADCAASYSSAPQAQAAANEYLFVYAHGEYKGEATGGRQLPCTEGQYAAFLDTKADPSRVMSAYPTAAGRPRAKTAK